MTTTLMVVTYNRLELTKIMLESLFVNTDSEFRIIIVDNGSTDGTVEWLKNGQWLNEKVWNNPNCLGKDVQFNEINRGIAIGRNQCLKIADKYNDEFLSTLDNDIRFIPGWLSKSVDIISVNPKFVVGLNMEDKSYPMLSRHGKSFQYKRIGNLGTACTVFSRSLHETIGFFTTEFGLYGEEDADYFYRARLHGWEMAYLPEMGIHLGQGQIEEIDYREFKNKCHNQNAAQFRKNCGEYTRKKKSTYIAFE